MAFELVEVENAQQNTDCRNQHALQTSDVRENVEHGVPRPLNDCEVQVHSNHGSLEQKFLVYERSYRNCFKRKRARVFKFSEFVEIDGQVLQKEICPFDFPDVALLPVTDSRGLNVALHLD